MSVTLINVALVTKESAISNAELHDVVAALQIQATRDFGPIWNIDATISAFNDLQHVPVGYWPILIEDNIGVPNAGGFHDEKKQPYARVLYSSDTPSWTIAASHEFLKMLADPSGNRVQTATIRIPEPRK